MSKKQKAAYFDPQTMDLNDHPTLHVQQSLNKQYGYALIDARILTRKRKVTFVLDYPLDGKFKFEATSPDGWSIAKGVRKIQQLYAQIYRSPGHYGVWGHGIGDLVIERINVSSDGRTISVDIGS